MFAYRVELVLPSMEITYGKNFINEEDARTDFKELIKEVKDDGYEYDYATIYTVSGEYELDSLDITDYVDTIEEYDFEYSDSQESLI